MENRLIKPDPAVTRRTVLTLASIFAPLIWALHLFWRRPEILDTRAALPSLFGSAVMSVIVAFGFAFLVGLAWLNFRRWRAILRPSLGKVLAAILMLGLTPLVVFSWIPWLFGVLAAMGIANGDVGFFAILVAAFGFWYTASGLVVSGISSKRWRVVVFSSFWFSGYFGIILVTGLLKFRL